VNKLQFTLACSYMLKDIRIQHALHKSLTL
jgi:hypothetical protein